MLIAEHKSYATTENIIFVIHQRINNDKIPLIIIREGKVSLLTQGFISLTDQGGKGNSWNMRFYSVEVCHPSGIYWRLV